MRHSLSTKQSSIILPRALNSGLLSLLSLKPKPMILFRPFWGIIAIILASAVSADSIKLTESLGDKIKCNADDCGVKTTGKYDLTLKLKSSTLNWEWAQIAADQTIAINIGNLTTETSLVAKNIRNGKIRATWFNTHEVCTKYSADNQDCVRNKQVKDTTISLSGDQKNGITFKASGNNSSQGVDGFGSTVFSRLCREANLNYLDDNYSISIGEQIVTGDLEITCKIKTRYTGDVDLIAITNNAQLKRPPAQACSIAGTWLEIGGGSTEKHPEKFIFSVNGAEVTGVYNHVNSAPTDFDPVSIVYDDISTYTVTNDCHDCGYLDFVVTITLDSTNCKRAKGTIATVKTGGEPRPISFIRK